MLLRRSQLVLVAARHLPLDAFFIIFPRDLPTRCCTGGLALLVRGCEVASPTDMGASGHSLFPKGPA